MKKFTAVCIDGATGYEMVLSDCSYNTATFYLEQQLDIVDASTKHDYVTDRTTMTYKLKDGSIRVFCYDEIRGYLMKVF